MRRLLVVEDDLDSLDMLSSLLEAGGYEVTKVQSSAVALHWLERETFDLVLADLMLESRRLDDSWTDIENLVKLARPAQVGLLTGWIVPQEEADKHGVAFVIRKPSTREELFSFLAAALHLPAIPSSRIALLRAYFKALEDRLYDDLHALCTDDVIYRLPGTDPKFSNEIRGREQFVPFTAQTFRAFPDTQFELTSIRPLPDGALVEYVSAWRDGEVVRTTPGAVMFELRDAAISRIEVRVPVESLH
jgi:CheY-like chemotaxis protein